MKLTVDRSQLKAALDRVTAVVASKTALPVLAHVRLEAAGEHLTLAATDLAVLITTRIPARVAAPGALTLPGKRLADIAAAAASADIEIDATGDGAKATVKAGRYRATLYGLSADDWPGWEFGDTVARWTMPGDDLAGLIAATAYAVSTDISRAYLAGVHFDAGRVDGEARLTAVATDGKRLARASAPLPAGAETLPGITLPTAAAGFARRIAAAAGAAPIEVAISHIKFRVVADTTTLDASLLADTYPDWRRVIPPPGDRRIAVDRAELAAAMKRVSLILGEAKAAMRLIFETGEPAGDGAAGPGRCRLEAWNANAGLASDEIAAEVTAEGAGILSFSAALLREAVEGLSGARMTLDHEGVIAGRTIFRTTDQDGMALVAGMLWRGPADAAAPPTEG